ncbi:MAG: tetratricopeptide repeat protein [Planctomycetaceae bacterium]
MRYSVLVAFVTLSLRLSQSACLFAEDIPQLRTILTDDFSRTSLADYQVEGDVTWQAGSITLAPDSSIGRPIEAGEWVEITLDLDAVDSARDNKQPQSIVTVTLDDGTMFLITWIQLREEDDVSTGVAIYEMVTRDGEVVPELMRKRSVPGPLWAGKWVISDRHGLLKIVRDGQQILAGYSTSAGSSVANVGCTQINAPGKLSSISIEASIKPAPLTAKQLQALDAAQAQDDQTATLYQKGDLRGAVTSAESAFETVRLALAKDHPTYIVALNKLASLHYLVDDYERAELLYSEARDISKHTLGENHPGYAQSIFKLATIYHERKDYQRAESLLVEAHDIIKHELGEEDPGYANSVNNLAVFYNSGGDYKKAEPLLVESLEIRKQVFGEEHPDYGEGLLNLADCCYAMGNHNRAESLYLELRNIRKRVMGGGSFGFTGTDQGETNGIVITAIEKEGAVGKAGLQIGDRVVAVAGKATRQWDEWGAATSGKKPGDKVSLTIRRDNRSVEKNVVVGEHPQHDISAQRLASFYTTRFEYRKAEPILVEFREIKRRVLGREHPDYVRSIKNLGVLYRSMFDFKRAEPFFVEFCDIKKRLLGEEHSDYADSLSSLAYIYYKMDDFKKAEPLFVEARDIIERVLGIEDPSYASSLDSLANLYHETGDYEKAEPLFVESLEIRKRVLGAEDPSCAWSLNNLARLYRSQGEYVKAESLLLEARNIFKRVRGTEHPDYAMSLNNLAELYQIQGEYAKTELLYIEARDIRKRVLGPEHPDYAASLHNLASLYQSQEDYAKAEPLYMEACDIQKRVLGTEHHYYAMGLNNLAELYRAQGDYVQAMPLFLEARDIFKRVRGTEHPDYAMSLGNLAILYVDTGDFPKAEPLFQEVRDIRKRVQGTEHPEYATSLANLAILYNAQGNYAKVEPLLLESCDIKRHKLGTGHPSYAISLNNLANNYRRQGDYSKAELLLLESRDIFNHALGAEHPTYATSVQNLALLYDSQGDYAKAEPLFLEARDIRERVLGTEHPDYATSLDKLAGLYRAQGDDVKAETLLRESLELSRRLVDRYAVGQSQTGQIKYATWLRDRLDALVSYGLDTAGAKSWIYDGILSWKGMTLVRQRQYRLATEDARAGPILESLTGVTRQLSAQLRQLPTPDTQTEWKNRIADLSEKRDVLEAQLATVSEQFRTTERLQTDELLEILPRDAVLIDLLSFAFWQRVPKDDYHVLESQRHFLASILRKGHPVQFVNLGPEADINDAVDKWRTVFLSTDPGDASGVEIAGRELRRLVWEPLLPHLEGTTTVIICPDRSLGRVSFAALPGLKPETFLIEDHRLACIPVPQLLPDLFRDTVAEDQPAGDLLLVGNVDYDADPDPTGDTGEPDRNDQTADLSQNVAFAALKETAGEIADIRDLFLELNDAAPESVRLLQEQAATEGSLRQYAGRYKALHFATHGFFADPSQQSVLQHAEQEASQRSGSILFDDRERSNYVQGFHPGQLSGLVLAGANRPATAGRDDGILTADEISFLPLEGVNLVVLSACETGLGPVAGGEGLLGVQRAFQVSGSRSVVASLWNVDDVATRRLMDRFYRNLLQQKMSKLDALREAQLWMLNTPESAQGSIVRGKIVRLKKPAKDATPRKGERTDPQYWAAFILSGDWR